jgi:predicted SPOUT superfamily RNA methylase MTH1
VGPGGAFNLGYGSGDAEEGLTVEMIDDKNKMDVGSDGTIMHSLRASNAGRITVRLLKTAPTNALLSALYNFQRFSSGNWGQNVIIVADTARGDLVNSSQMAFVKQSDLTYAQDGNYNTWVFIGSIDNELLGTGTPSAN